MKASPRLCLQADEPISTGPSRVCGVLLQRAIKRLGHRGDNPAKAIHVARISIKHVRAILRLIRPAVGEEIFRLENAQLRKAAQSLGSMRDAVAGVRTLERLAKKAGKKKRRVIEAVARRFAAGVQADHLADEGSALRETARMLEPCRQWLRQLRVGEDGEIFAAGLEKVYRACRKRTKQACAGNDDANFHRWRIRLKSLYYELQFLVPVWPKHLRRLLGDLEKLQVKLGRDHDLAMLKATLLQTPHRFADEAERRLILHEVEKRSRKLRGTCQALGEKVFAEKPGRLLQKYRRHAASWRRAAKPR